MKIINRVAKGVVRIKISTHEDCCAQEIRDFSEQQVYEILRAYIAVKELETSAVYFNSGPLVIKRLDI